MFLDTSSYLTLQLMSDIVHRTLTIAKRKIAHQSCYYYNLNDKGHDENDSQRYLDGWLAYGWLAYGWLTYGWLTLRLC